MAVDTARIGLDVPVTSSPLSHDPKDVSVALRLRRSLALLAPALLLPVAACGETTTPTAEGSDAYEITAGEAGEPSIEWSEVMEVTDEQTDVLVEGEGDTLAEGDRVMVNLLVSNGFTHQTVVDTFGDTAAGSSLVVGEAGEPQSFGDVLLGAVADDLDGLAVGTRLAITTNAEEAFGDVRYNLGPVGIGSEDGLLMIVEAASVPLETADGAEQDVPGWVPGVSSRNNGNPKDLDFSGLTEPKPADDLRVATLIQGDGPELETGDVATVRYLGQVFGADEPFDQAYAGNTDPLDVALIVPDEEAEPDPATLSTNVIEGWVQGLTGVSVGSRVVIQIPPRLGYGEEAGNPDAGIGPDDTMYFVVDVLGAA